MKKNTYKKGRKNNHSKVERRTKRHDHIKRSKTYLGRQSD